MSRPAIVQVRRNEALYYLYMTFRNFAFSRAIFMLFLIQRGMSNVQIGTLQSILFFSTFLLEIPTGLFADRFGRRYSMLAGGLLVVTHTVAIVIFDSFVAYSLLFAIYGASMAFNSGSDTALLYDSLKSEGRKADFIRVSSRAHSLGLIALGLAMCAGGFLREVSWNTVYLAYSFCLLIAWIATWLMVEPPNGSVDETRADNGSDETSGVDLGESETPSILDIFKNLLTGKTGRLLLVFVIAYGLFEGVLTPLYIYGQNLFANFGWNERWIGVLFAVIQFSSGGITLFSEWISKKIPLNKLTYLILSVSTILVASFVARKIAISLPVFLILTVVPEVFFVIKERFLHDAIPSQVRASFMSLSSFVQSVFISVTYLIYGFLLETHTVHIVLAGSSLIILMSLLIFIAFFALWPTESQAQCSPK